MLPNKFGKSVSAELRFGPKWKRVAAADSQKNKLTNWASRRLLAVQPSLNRALVLMVAPDCGNQHVDIKQVNHGGNCSSALKIASREIGRPIAYTQVIYRARASSCRPAWILICSPRSSPLEMTDPCNPWSSFLSPDCLENDRCNNTGEK